MLELDALMFVLLITRVRVGADVMASVCGDLFDCSSPSTQNWQPTNGNGQTVRLGFSRLWHCTLDLLSSRSSGTTRSSLSLVVGRWSLAWTAPLFGCGRVVLAIIQSPLVGIVWNLWIVDSGLWIVDDEQHRLDGPCR